MELVQIARQEYCSGLFTSVIQKGKNWTMTKLLNIDELAAKLNIRKSTIYVWVHKRKIPFIKLGSRLLFNEYEIDKFIAKFAVKAEM